MIMLRNIFKIHGHFLANTCKFSKYCYLQYILPEWLTGSLRYSNIIMLHNTAILQCSKESIVYLSAYALYLLSYKKTYYKCRIQQLLLLPSF